ncbi:MAG: Trk system potassium transporter TrkA [Chitinivibrionales bacterium]|nr:Trk system potassium transporter TrkA [Chitinivibrionales bacterium]
MKIIIVGAGTIGFSLADLLSQNNHYVSLIENDKGLCNEVNSKLDVFTVNGNGSSLKSLEQAGIRDVDMIIAVTPRDETNILVCLFASHYNVKRRIARIISDEYTLPEAVVSLADTGVTDVIETEKEVVGSILQYLELPGVTLTANFQSDNVYLRGYVVGDHMPIANRTLAEVTRIAGPAPLLIVVIVREGRSIIPSGDELLLPGDELIAIMHKDAFVTFREMIGHGAEKLKKVIISGDTLTAVHLADALKPWVERIVLVDPDETHGQQAAAQLDGIEVIHGDCTKAEILQELHIQNASFFIAAGKDTEDNVMSCLLAKAEGTREVIAVNNSDRHAALFKSLGLDHIINPRKITVQKIIGSVLRIPIRAHLGLQRGDVEIVRTVAEANSRVVGKALKDLNKVLKKNVVLGAIMRQDHAIIPRGDTIIQENDEVIVICRQEKSKTVTRLFKSGPSIPV